jgi:hypothetical protein
LCSPVSLSLLLLAAAALRVMRRPEPSLCVACVWGSSTADSSSVFRVRRDTLSGERSTILGLVTLCAWASARERDTHSARHEQQVYEGQRQAGVSESALGDTSH